jgi:hypothetical protein
MSDVVITHPEGGGDAADAAEAASDAAVEVAEAVSEGIADAAEAISDAIAAAVEAVADAQPDPVVVPPVEHDHSGLEARLVACEAYEVRLAALEAALLAEDDEPVAEVIEPDVTPDELDEDTNAGSGGGFWARLLKG